MLVSSKKRKLLIWGICTPVGVGVLAGIIVGGSALAKDANPYVDYAKAPISELIESYLAVYYAYLLNDSHMMVLPGFSLTPSLKAALLDSKYDNAAFLLLDDVYEGESTRQVAGASFRSDQGSFITGISIAMYLNENKDYFLGSDNKLTWGAYGGMNFSSVTSFMTGIQLGISWFNDNIVSLDPNLTKIEQISLGTTANDSYAGAFGPNDGDALIDKFLQKDVDCLIPVAGPQCASAVNKIESRQKRTVVIGVDSAVENDPGLKDKLLPATNNRPKNPQIIPFSSLKNIGLMTYNILNNISQGHNDENLPNQDIGGLGYQSLGTIANSCVGVSENGQSYFIEAIKKIDSKVTDYATATNYAKSLPLFASLDDATYCKFVPLGASNPEVNSVTNFESATKDNSFDYPPLPKNGFKLDADPGEKTVQNFMSPTVPNNLKNNFSQADWEVKYNTPERMKKLLNPATNPKFANEIKIILSKPSSVLLDASFSQSAYDGVAAFYKKNNVNIPFTNSTESLINLINQLNPGSIPNSVNKDAKRKELN